jgi:uncharacterized membrane protein
VTRSRATLVGAAGLGLALSAYLTWIHWSGDLALCLGAGGCEAVQASRFATVGPVPVALIGLLGFGALLLTALLWTRARAWAGTVAFAIALGATLYVAYLTYLELFVIGAICPWCVAVGVCAVASLALVVRDLATEPAAPQPPDLPVSS